MSEPTYETFEDQIEDVVQTMLQSWAEYSKDPEKYDRERFERELSIESEPMPLEESIRLLREFNPHHDQDGRFSSGASNQKVHGRLGPSHKPKADFQAALDAFAEAPLEHGKSKEAKAWRKKNEKLYVQNDDFALIADAALVNNQGGYKRIRGPSAKLNGGHSAARPASEWSGGTDDYNPNDKIITGPGSGGYGAEKTAIFKGQAGAGSWKGPYVANQTGPFGRVSKHSYGEGAEALNRAIVHSKPLDMPLYRGWNGRDSDPHIAGLKKLKPGDTFDVHGISSFSADKYVADTFAQGWGGLPEHVVKARAFGGVGNERVIMEVAPGAHGIKTAALSTWKQKEVVTQGRFRVVSVDSELPAWSTVRAKRHIIRVEQVGVWEP